MPMVVCIKAYLSKSFSLGMFSLYSEDITLMH